MVLTDSDKNYFEHMMGKAAMETEGKEQSEVEEINN